MKLINKIKDKIWDDVYGKVFEHAPYDSPVRKQIKKNLGVVWNDNFIVLKIRNQKDNIGNDLNETD